MIHKDIKPSNIVFMEDGVTVKLVDFGAAIEIDKPLNHHHLVGTVYFI